VGAVSRGRSAARRLRFALAFVLVAAPAAVAWSAAGQAVGSGQTVGSAFARARTATAPVAGAWRRLSPAPIATVGGAVSVWTGRQMLVFGRAQPNPPWSVDVAAGYNPTTDTWRRLAPFPGPTGNYEGHYSAVWTGKEMLIWGPGDREAFNPSTNHWRRLPSPPLSGHDAAGVVVWTGREMVGWGGGCCGDAFSDGAAYNPTANTWRKLSPAPVGGQQSPTATWTGRELIVLNGRNAEGKAVGGAAYNPTTNRWRRIAPLPETGGAAVWDGHEILVVGGGAHGRSAHAYAPATNRWRRIASMPSRREGAAAVWTGKRLLIWGGTTSSLAAVKLVTPNQGLAYDPRGNRWSALPGAPLPGRLDPTAVWTGHAMIVWGGYRPAIPAGAGERVFADGAAFRPATP